ncbi:MAG: 4Fe-4S cluster-binding domain-containing protein, partial [Candidatus Bathyarchaeota archaeon]|nr:4Fe-4S cluster-binding domain-containing protein [Candidatus Bathyarchaeota archaeon]
MDLRKNQALTPIESGFPITAITLDLTKACNLACDYCFSHCFDKSIETSHLSEETGKKVIDWLFNESTNGGADKVELSFWGGEPLLKFDLMKSLILYAEGKSKETGIRITFGGTTNVTLLTEDKFDFLEEHGCYFLLSVDGREVNHDMHRKYPNGKGSWKDVDANLTKIVERWPFAKARISFSVETIDTFLDDLKYLYSKGIRDIAYSPVSEGDWTKERLIVLKDVWTEVSMWYCEMHEAGDPVSLKYIEDSCSQAMGNHMGNSAPCGAGRGYVGISIDGAIRPCHRFNKMTDERAWYEQETVIGHIDYGILNHEFRSNFTNWDPNKDMNPACANCKAKGVG